MKETTNIRQEENDQHRRGDEIIRGNLSNLLEDKRKMHGIKLHKKIERKKEDEGIGTYIGMKEKTRKSEKDRKDKKKKRWTRNKIIKL